MNAVSRSERLALVVLALAALCLAAMPSPPARAVTVFAPSKSIQIAGVFSPTKPVAGAPATLTLMIVSPLGKLVNGAKVSADVNMTSMDMGTSHPSFKAIGMGKYRASVTFSMGGSWAVKVHVKTSGGLKGGKTIVVKVADQ